MEKELLDDVIMDNRIEYYANTNNGNNDDYDLVGHCRKHFVRINDNSVNFEHKFLKSINPVTKLSSKERLKLLFNTYVLRRKSSFIEYFGTKNLPQKTIQDSVIFSDLFEALQYGDSSYITCFGDSLKDGSSYIPHYVSCLQKQCYFEEAYRECVGSRLANLFGIDVVYNTMQDMVLHKRSLKPSPTIVKMVDAHLLDSRWVNMYSVDMIPPGYIFENFNWFTNQDIVGCETLEKVSNRFKSFMELVAAKKQLDVSEEKYNELECAVLKQVFVKKHILQDGDLASRNFGFLLNEETGDVRISPMFDMEFIFAGSPSDRNDNFKSIIDKDIAFFYNKYPRQFSEMMSRVNLAVQSGAVEGVVYGSFPNSKYKSIMGRAAQVFDWIDIVQSRFVKVVNSQNNQCSMNN